MLPPVLPACADRPSQEECYGLRGVYLARAEQVAKSLVKNGFFLLEMSLASWIGPAPSMTG